jgi:branched-chain amino acid transport system ATP-binding protein
MAAETQAARGGPGGPALLEAEDLVHAYGGITALHGVSLRVAPGEAVTIVGPNGAGKTTLSKVLAGILRPARGSVSFDGRRISGLRPERVAAAGVGTVLEGRHVFPDQSVRTNLELGAYWRRLRGAALDEELERAFGLFPDLERFAGRPASSLSGGQQQMLAVARALMGAPRLLVLDEPSMGLSPKLVGEVYEALRSLRDSGLAILLVEQNARRAFELCGRGYVLQYGRIALEGRVEALREADLVRKIYLGSENIAA